LKASEIRARFLAYFEALGHRIVPSASLVPRDDPTLLFTNAGMNQFKAVLMGLEQRDYRRAASVQKCMRVSGKHNDLEEVGKDLRHHTFFEMLGNWSFGDYYKRESLVWGWEFLTREMGLPAERLWASVYKDDDEAYDIWLNIIKLPAERILRLGDLDRGDEENFWAMAETGPCGPCSEIHMDQGADMACDHPAGCALGVCDCDRWLELWNHVFMEFDRDAAGNLAPLPMKSVDTGLGFERLAAVMQGVRSNYESDLFTPLIERTAALSGVDPQGPAKVSLQVVADHARAVCFTVADGALPSNEGRGYVVRRILRRAARHGRLLDLTEPFLWRVAETVIDTMGEAYPELVEHRERVLKTIRLEEERFNRTLDSGLQIYAEIRGRMQAEGRRQLTGEEAFRLHDTYGFPVDLTAVVAEEDGFTVDQAGFAACMERQRATSGSERKYREGISAWQPLAGTDAEGTLRGEFLGYATLEHASQPLAIRQGGAAEQGEPVCHLLFAASPFYAEAGGQVGDKGEIILQPGGQSLTVLDTIPTEEGPACVVPGTLADISDKLAGTTEALLKVDPRRRLAIMRHHTATHLLHAALRQVLGSQVEQAGSVVGPDRLRFDFRHAEAVAPEDLQRVEAMVNEVVLANLPVLVQDRVPLADAKRRGAMALFGEKYSDEVRMIQIGEDDTASVFSLELCGGTHCTRTGDVGPVWITSESSSAAGVRRIEAVAGEPALQLAVHSRQQLRGLHQLLKSDEEAITDQVKNLLAERDALRKKIRQQNQSSARAGLDAALGDPIQVGDLTVVVARVEADNRESLMQLGDHARDKLQRGVVVLAADWEGKATLIATVTGDLVQQKRLHAGDLVKAIAAKVGGRGGGRPHMAQAGLPDVAAIAPALEAAVASVRELVADQAE
jgi:alanyl-tRNA synthetase